MIEERSSNPTEAVINESGSAEGNHNVNKPIRVMLCDDSSVIRRLVKGALTTDPQMHVVYEAVDGKDAVDNLGSVRPDVVILDVEMPVMDGIDAARTIRRRCRTLPIIMFSSLTSQGAEATMDALAAGANDFAIKPAGTNNFQAAKEQVQKELIGKIRDLVGTPADVQEKLGTQKAAPVSPGVQRRTARPSRRETIATPEVSTFKGSKSHVSVIAIGVSTGGPEALRKLILKLPKPFPVPILIAQHMPPVFTGLLADRLSQQSGHRVRQATEGENVTAGEILIAPGDFHLTVCREKNNVKTRLDQSPPENSCRPSVDPLFRSIGKVYGREAIAVVLTGMGTDGGAGSRAIKQTGGRVIVQDQESSVVWGMPGHVAEIGLADRVLPLEQIATELIRAVESKQQPASV
jgi:two-component system chemotaxis response regulator CheB